MFMTCVHQVVFDCSSYSRVVIMLTLLYLELQKTFAPKRKAIEEAEEKRIQQEREKMKRKAMGDEVNPTISLLYPFYLFFFFFFLSSFFLFLSPSLPSFGVCP